MLRLSHVMGCHLLWLSLAVVVTYCGCHLLRLSLAVAA